MYRVFQRENGEKERMTRVLDDLKVLAVDWLKYEKIGKRYFKRNGEFTDYVNTHKAFFILLRKEDEFYTEQDQIETLLHELEHYDISKTLLAIGIPPSRGQALYPEWVHSNPSE